VTPKSAAARGSLSPRIDERQSVSRAYSLCAVLFVVLYVGFSAWVGSVAQGGVRCEAEVLRDPSDPLDACVVSS
jgi:hypothetical protein